jgi:uncharacterized membrane protein
MFESDAAFYSILVIAMVALGTYALRLSGLLLANRIPNTPGFNRVMDTLPGTILLAIIVPEVIKSGPYGFLAVAATVACTLATRNVFISMCAGILVMVLLR